MLPTDFVPPAGPDLTAPGFAEPPTWFSAVFVIIVGLVAAGIIFAVVTSVRKYRVLKDAGVDPFTVDAAVAAKVLNSGLLAPAAQAAAPTAPERSLEARLAELDDLVGRGVITAEERATARAEILRS